MDKEEEQSNKGECSAHWLIRQRETKQTGADASSIREEMLIRGDGQESTRMQTNSFTFITQRE